MKRRISQLLLGVLALTMAVVVAAYLVVSSSLPQLDGSIQVAGLSADTTIGRDAQGIVTIRGENRADVAYATGFAHGQDRFFQMDLTRRKAAGELAELFGPIALDMDKRSRFHRFRARSDAVVKNMSAAESDVLDAYVAGVNEGLGSLDAKPFEYFLLGSDPAKWSSQDSMLVAYAMFMVLNDERASSDIRRGIAEQLLPSEVFAWMYPRGTSWDAPMMGAARAEPPVPSADVYDISTRHLRAGRVTQYPEATVPGSNNWAISGSLTESGRAIVANDMHLEITVPNVFYRVRLVVDGASDTTGLSLPGAPIVIAGSNGHVAWGFTNSYGDWSDAVVVRPDGNGGYLAAGGARSFDIYDEEIRVKGGDPVTYQVRETIWGPVLDDASNPNGETAVAWVAHDSEALNLNLLQLETVESVDEALAIANTLGMPPQNFVCGDADGNIGWTLTGRIPRREGYDPWLPADWSAGAGWHGWLEPTEYPRIVNPESGRIWTANARVADGEALRLIGDGGYDLGARQQQIRDALMASERFGVADMLAVQNDDRALFLSRWRGLLLELLNKEDNQPGGQRAAYRDQVAAWVPRASVDSVGYRLVREFRLDVRATVFEMLVAPVRDVHGDAQELRISNQFESALWQLVTERPAHLLAADFLNWEELMLSVADRQIDGLNENYPDGIENRTWGERNMAAVRHPLSRAVPQLSAWLDMPQEPLSGDVNMPKALGPSFGASERFGVSPGDEAGAYLHMPAGQSGHPWSDFYRAGHEYWVRVLPAPFLPGDTLHTLLLHSP